MGFQKFNRSEGHQTQKHGKISNFLQKLGKTSAGELTDEERQLLEGNNEPNNNDNKESL